MMVMPANNTSAKVRDLWERFPGRIGHLMSPGGIREPFGVYALDNGAYGAFLNHRPWDAEAFKRHCATAARLTRPPEWVAVPDVVGNRTATLSQWPRWSGFVRDYQWRPAFVVQDGMTETDIPSDAPVIFVGGSTHWKWSSLPTWCAAHPYVHVGRVNSPRALRRCAELGVVSVDGTGWTRGDQDQWNGLVQFLADPTTDHRGVVLMDL